MLLDSVMLLFHLINLTDREVEGMDFSASIALWATAALGSWMETTRWEKAQLRVVCSGLLPFTGSTPLAGSSIICAST